MTRVTVFSDYQNLYHSARESFTDPRLAPPTDGHVHPVQLGETTDGPRGARDSLFDVAVVVSADTDLVPALEAALEAGVRVETATFSGPGASARALQVPGRRIWNHRLTQTDFRSVADTTNYLHG